MFFFFSSRRRHTRFSRDWSSDVCSSDLLESFSHPRSSRKGRKTLVDRQFSAARNGLSHRLPPAGGAPADDSASHPPASESRSEERRVGKECRSRWWAYDEKRKDVDVDSL